MSPVNNPQMQHLVDDRATKIAIRDKAAKEVEALNAQLMELMLQTGEKRYQLHSGDIVAIVQNPPRTTVVPERLLGYGVSPKIIEDSTKTSPVAPFIRVDRPKVPGQPTIAERIADRTMDPKNAADPTDVTH